MPKSKKVIKDVNSPLYNKNATPKRIYYLGNGVYGKRRPLTHTDPVIRTKDNAGLHLKANKSYCLNEQRKANMGGA